MEIIPQGTIHLKLGDEHYEWYVIVSMAVKGPALKLNQEPTVVIHS